MCYSLLKIMEITCSVFIIQILYYFLLVSVAHTAEELPTNYEYYTSGGIKSGLVAEGDHFTLNGKEIRIFSGSLHYFRVPQPYWRDRLTKMRAAGLNAVQFYSPWNLHEEIPDHYDFENGFLNITDFLVAIKEADMFALHRPGPYICAEWENGGLPAWLLRDPNMKVRSNYKPFVSAATKYFAKIVNITKSFQFSTNGGPIIAAQIENEFQSFGNTDENKEDFQYLTALKNAVRDNGFKELLYTSDPWVTTKGSLPDLLRTANFNEHAVEFLTNLKKSQPNKPLYVAEYWPGWFDKWGDAYHHTRSVQLMAEQYEDIVFKMNASVNIYMFHGGTNFAFMNGDYTVTSYDYDAPISEEGNYTDKYWKVKEIIERFNKDRNATKTRTTQPPKVSAAKHYGLVNITDYASYDVLLQRVNPIVSEKPVHMEMLNISSNYGQNFGFLVYRTKMPKTKVIKFTGGVSDRALIIIDGKLIEAYYQTVGQHKDFELNIDSLEYYPLSQSEHTLDIIVECMGRSNGGQIMNEERMGLNGDITLDGIVHNNWTMFALDFRQKFVEELTKSNQIWKPYANDVDYPAIYRAVLNITESMPSDTFLKLDNWRTGIVFVNGFNIGRYWNIGPQKTLYIPAPFLKTGINNIYIFELYSSPQVNNIELIDRHILG